jgi:RNA polymerase sigma-70 factor (ECF subfamily)
MRDYSLAEDMMQDTFLKVKYNINYYKSGTNPKAWINSIAKNVCLNELKRRKREVFVDFNSREDLNITYDMKVHDESGIITLVMKYLNKNESQIVLMHTLGDISLKEIAAILEKPQGTIRWQYNNSLSKLRKIIKREEL